MTIICDIVTQARVVYQGEADIVILPGEDGEVGILPDHSPLLTILNYGIIKVRLGEEEKIFIVFGGVAEVQPDQVTILADAAENLKEIDIEETESEIRRAERALRRSEQLTEDEELDLQDSLQRNTMRLEAVRRYREGAK